MSAASDAGDEDDTEPELKPRPSSHVLGSKSSTNAHAFILGVLIVLSFDTLNPVKRVTLLLFDSADSTTLGWLFFALLVLLVLQDLDGRVFATFHDHEHVFLCLLVLFRHCDCIESKAKHFSLYFHILLVVNALEA